MVCVPDLNLPIDDFTSLLWPLDQVNYFGIIKYYLLKLKLVLKNKLNLTQMLKYDQNHVEHGSGQWTNEAQNHKSEP